MPFYKLKQDFDLQHPLGCVTFKANAPAWVPEIFALESLVKSLGATLMTQAEVDAYRKSLLVVTPALTPEQVQAVAEANVLPTSYSDKITSLREAAHFLRQATLGGGTWAEIQRVFALGSRRAWLAEQLYTPEASRLYPAWTGADESVEGMGWFGGVMLKLATPRNRTSGGQYPNFTFPGTATTTRAVQTAFLLNASDSPNRHFYDPTESVRIKATWVLSKMIPCSIPGGAWSGPDKAMPIMSWYGMLHRYAFRNYADLLEAVTYHPAMARMLTYTANEKQVGEAHPDENYAREIMQLFTLGLYELNIDGTEKLDSAGQRTYTYTNDDIRQMARVFTGLCRWDVDGANYTIDSPAVRTSMLATALEGQEAFAYNDGRADAYFTTAPGVNARLRHYIPFYEYGAKVALNGRVNIPAGTEPRENIKMAIKALVDHPNCAPFVAKNLIKQTVTSNPSPGYVSRVARVFENDGTGVRGNLAAVWEAILSDPEASNTVFSDSKHGRVRDGYEVFASLVRPFSRESAIPTVADNIADTATNSAVWIDGVHQTGVTRGLIWKDPMTWAFSWPYNAPSIFGYYSPDYAAAPASDWGLVTPEIQAYAASILMWAGSEVVNLISQGEPRDTEGGAVLRVLDYATILPVTGTAAELAERINLIFCGGTMAPKKQEALVALIGGMATGTTTQQQDRIGIALNFAGFSTEFWVM
jgi:hypothetical protein